MRKKTKKMLQLEEMHGRDIVQILADAYTEHQTLERAAASLGVPAPTYYGWLQRFGIEIRKQALVPRMRSRRAS